MIALILFAVLFAVVFMKFSNGRRNKAFFKRPDYGRTNPAASEILAREREEMLGRRQRQRALTEQRLGLTPGLALAGSDNNSQTADEAAALERRAAQLESELSKQGVPSRSQEA